MNPSDNPSRFAIANFERRRHGRFVINLPVEYRKLDQSRKCPGWTGDLSEGGLLLHISEAMNIGQELEITVFIDSGAGLKPIEAKGKVVWKDFQVGREEFHRVGVNFSEITPDNQSTLKDFLSNLFTMKALGRSNSDPLSQSEDPEGL